MSKLFPDEHKNHQPTWDCCCWTTTQLRGSTRQGMSVPLNKTSQDRSDESNCSSKSFNRTLCRLAKLHVQLDPTNVAQYTCSLIHKETGVVRPNIVWENNGELSCQQSSSNHTSILLWCEEFQNKYRNCSWKTPNKRPVKI